MKVRRSFIAIQTWSSIHKSEHLAAGGLHCCLATVGPSVPVLVPSPQPPPPHCAHSFLSLPGPCSGDPGPYTQSSHGSISCSGWWSLPTSLLFALLLAPEHPCVPRPLSCLLLCLAHTVVWRGGTQGSAFQSISDAILGGIVCTITSCLLSSPFLGTQH